MKNAAIASFGGKRALVTGARSGIGKATACLPADAGAEICLLGRTTFSVQFALKFLRKRGGSVVVVSSVNGTRFFSNSGAAQVPFPRMLALGLAKDGIRVNAVCPGAVKTNIDKSTELRDLKDLHLRVVFPEGEVPLSHGKPGCVGLVAPTIHFLTSDLSGHLSGTETHFAGTRSLLQR